MVKIIKLPKGKYEYQVIDSNKWYPVRSENSITKVKKWVEWSKKNSNQKLFILDRVNLIKSSEYWKMRYKGGYEDRYIVYANY